MLEINKVSWVSSAQGTYLIYFSTKGFENNLPEQRVVPTSIEGIKDVLPGP